MWAEIVKVKRLSNKAILIVYETVEAWIPFSQILDDSEIYEKSKIGEEGNLSIPDWLAEGKGLVI